MGGLGAAHPVARRLPRYKIYWLADARLLDGRVKPGHGEREFP